MLAMQEKDTSMKIGMYDRCYASDVEVEPTKISGIMSHLFVECGCLFARNVLKNR